MTMNLNSRSLKESITQFMMAMSKQAPQEVLSSMEKELKSLSGSGIDKQALKVGAKAPDFTLPEVQGANLSLSTLLAKGPVVVTFYRGGWCPFCDLQLRAYQSILSDIRKFGAELIAISPQDLEFALSDVEKKELTFPIVSDLHNNVARQYGLVFQLSNSLKEIQKTLGSPLPKFNGDDSWELPIPATFVLNQSGVVVLAHVDPDYVNRLEPSLIFETLQKISKKS